MYQSYYRSNKNMNGFILPFLAGAIISPIFINAIDDKPMYQYPTQPYGYYPQNNIFY